MAHHTPARVTVAQTIDYILSAAGRPNGVSADEVAEFCGLTVAPARSRIGAASSKHPGVLIKAERELGFRRVDIRWFIHKSHADAFRHGRTADCAGPRAPVTTVDLPTNHAPAAGRAGAQDFKAHGSRRGNWIYYRDGSREPINPTSQPQTQQDATHA